MNKKITMGTSAYSTHGTHPSLACHYPVSAPDIITQRETEDTENSARMFGFIFLCSGETKPECFRYRVFGLPIGQLDTVKKIEPGARLFLFDFRLKHLYGIYSATSKGEMNLEPSAFNGKFPAQVRFKIVSDCLPLPESSFKHAIRDNYQGSKFRQELSSKQVEYLVSLFRPILFPSSDPAVPTVSNVVAEHTRAPIRVGHASGTLPARSLPLEYSYLSGASHSHALYDLNAGLNGSYQSQMHGTHAQSSTQPQYVVQPVNLSHHGDPCYSAEAPHGYPYYSAERCDSLSTYDPGRSYEVASAMASRANVPGYQNQFSTSQLPRQEAVLSSDDVANYHSKYLHAGTYSLVATEMALRNNISGYQNQFSTSQVPSREAVSSSDYAMYYHSQYQPAETSSYGTQASLQPQASASNDVLTASSYGTQALHTQQEAVFSSGNVMNYYSQYLPTGTNSLAALQPQTLPSNHTLIASYSTQGGLPPSNNQQYYAPPTHEDLGQNVNA